MKLFEDSLMTLPIRFLKLFSKGVREYYSGVNNASDAYEHVYAGVIGSLVFELLAVAFCKWFLLGKIVVFLVHVVWKEIWIDREKHWLNPNPTEATWLNLKVDLTLRIIGFVLTAPFDVIALIVRGN